MATKALKPNRPSINRLGKTAYRDLATFRFELRRFL